MGLVWDGAIAAANSAEFRNRKRTAENKRDRGIILDVAILTECLDAFWMLADVGWSLTVWVEP